MRRPAISWGIFLLLAPSVGRGQETPLEAPLLIKGWRETADALQLETYTLSGSIVTRVGPGANLGQPARGPLEQVMNWRSRVSGPRYWVEWQEFGQKTRAQAYDGKRWTGQTRGRDAAVGSITRDPKKSLDMDLNEHLEFAADGRFYPTLANAIKRPLNANSRELLAAIEANSKRYRVKREGKNFALECSTEDAIRLVIPYKVVLLPIQQYLVPVSGNLRLRDADASYESTFSTVEVGHTKRGVPFRQKFTSTFVRTPHGGSPQLLATTETDLKTDFSYRPQPNDFSVEFERRATVFDDEKGVVQGAKKSGVSSEGFFTQLQNIPVKGWPFLGIGLGAWLFMRSRRK